MSTTIQTYTSEADFEEDALTPEEAAETILAMRQAVEEVPSYVAVQALIAWLENGEQEL